MTPYRTPDPATTIARLTRECERLRGELAAATERPPGRWRVRSPGYGAAVGNAVGLAISMARGYSTPAHAALAWLALWPLWALLFLRREPAPSDGGGL